jgi:hypothetical protein
MKRLPKGKPAEIMGLRYFQTMYTAAQMRKYANKLVADEREACAKVCEDKNTLLAWPTYAAAIRARGQA